MKNNDVNRNILRAISIGLAATLTLMPTTAAFAGDDDGKSPRRHGSGSGGGKQEESKEHRHKSEDKHDHEHDSDRSDVIEESRDEVRNVANDVAQNDPPAPAPTLTETPETPVPTSTGTPETPAPAPAAETPSPAEAPAPAPAAETPSPAEAPAPAPAAETPAPAAETPSPAEAPAPAPAAETPAETPAENIGDPAAEANQSDGSESKESKEDKYVPLPSSGLLNDAADQLGYLYDDSGDVDNKYYDAEKQIAFIEGAASTDPDDQFGESRVDGIQYRSDTKDKVAGFTDPADRFTGSENAETESGKKGTAQIAAETATNKRASDAKEDQGTVWDAANYNKNDGGYDNKDAADAERNKLRDNVLKENKEILEECKTAVGNAQKDFEDAKTAEKEADDALKDAEKKKADAEKAVVDARDAFIKLLTDNGYPCHYDEESDSIVRDIVEGETGEEGALSGLGNKYVSPTDPDFSNLGENNHLGRAIADAEAAYNRALNNRTYANSEYDDALSVAHKASENADLKNYVDGLNEKFNGIFSDIVPDSNDKNYQKQMQAAQIIIDEVSGQVSAVGTSVTNAANPDTEGTKAHELKIDSTTKNTNYDTNYVNKLITVKDADGNESTKSYQELLNDYLGDIKEQNDMNDKATYNKGDDFYNANRTLAFYVVKYLLAQEEGVDPASIKAVDTEKETTASAFGKDGTIVLKDASKKGFLVTYVKNGDSITELFNYKPIQDSGLECSTTKVNNVIADADHVLITKWVNGTETMYSSQRYINNLLDKYQNDGTEKVDAESKYNDATYMYDLIKDASDNISDPSKVKDKLDEAIAKREKTGFKENERLDELIKLIGNQKTVVADTIKDSKAKGSKAYDDYKAANRTLVEYLVEYQLLSKGYTEINFEKDKDGNVIWSKASPEPEHGFIATYKDENGNLKYAKFDWVGVLDNGEIVQGKTGLKNSYNINIDHLDHIEVVSKVILTDENGNQIIDTNGQPETDGTKGKLFIDEAVFTAGKDKYQTDKAAYKKYDALVSDIESIYLASLQQKVAEATLQEKKVEYAKGQVERASGELAKAQEKNLAVNAGWIAELRNRYQNAVDALNKAEEKYNAAVANLGDIQKAVTEMDKCINDEDYIKANGLWSYKTAVDTDDDKLDEKPDDDKKPADDDEPADDKKPADPKTDPTPNPDPTPDPDPTPNPDPNPNPNPKPDPTPAPGGNGGGGTGRGAGGGTGGGAGGTGGGAGGDGGAGGGAGETGGGTGGGAPVSTFADPTFLTPAGDGGVETVIGGGVLGDLGVPAITTGGVLGDTLAPVGDAAGGVPVAEAGLLPEGGVLGERMAPFVEAVENGNFNRSMLFTEEGLKLPFAWWLLILVLGIKGVMMIVENEKKKQADVKK